MTLAGYYVLIQFFELATSFFIVSSLSIIQAANIDISVDLSWHAPISSRINSLSSAINGTGTYGFVFNSSTLPEYIPYGIVMFFLSKILVAPIYLGAYNWCNMPHLRRAEYPKVNSSYILGYVEVIHRHHKRTPYAPIPFQSRPTHGTATTKPSSTTAPPYQSTVPMILPTPTGAYTPPHLILWHREDLTELVNFHRSPAEGLTTAGSMAMICTASTTTCLGSCLKNTIQILSVSASRTI